MDFREENIYSNIETYQRDSATFGRESGHCLHHLLIPLANLNRKEKNISLMKSGTKIVSKIKPSKYFNEKILRNRPKVCIHRRTKKE